MHYASTLENLESFWNSLCMCSTHHVGAKEILYTFVKVRESYKLLMVVNNTPGSFYFDS